MHKLSNEAIIYKGYKEGILLFCYNHLPKLGGGSFKIRQLTILTEMNLKMSF